MSTTNNSDRLPIPHPSCAPSTLEDLIDMFPAILVRGLEILEFLSEILNVRFEARRLACQPFVHLACRAEDKPANGNVN